LKKIFIILGAVPLFVMASLTTYAATAPLAGNQSFSKAKKTLLKKVYYDHHETFYCQVPFDIKRAKGKEKAVVDPVQDGFHYRKNKKRASRIEWEHVMPAENFGKPLACWRNGDAMCVNSKGKSYKGRRCCTKVSAKYRLMQADMMNLVPAIGEVNGDRSNYRYADTNRSIKGQYGNCPITTNFKERKTYPADYTKGFIARDYLYMSQKYGIKLSKQQLKMMQIWDLKYPVTAWELERKKRIEALQGK